MRVLVPWMKIPLLLLFAIPALAQEYSYIHYDVKDGLAGSTVYCMTQDRDGFMWFGTETGLSRFDGTHFKNFYTDDGLPDSEIINLFSDSKNRVWIVPFRYSIAYYQNGRIHNQQNDSLLKRIKIQSEVMSVVENKAGDVLIQEKNTSHIIFHDGKTISIKAFGGIEMVAKAGLNNEGGFRLFSVHGGKEIMISDIDQGRLVIKKKLKLRYSLEGEYANDYRTIYISPRAEIFRNGKDSLRMTDNADHSVFNIPVTKNFLSISEVNDSSITLNTRDSVLLFDIDRKKVTAVFLRGQMVNAVKEDPEGNLWFSVYGKGIYRLGSTGVLNYYFKTPNNSSAVYSLKKTDSALYIGTDHFFLWDIDLKTKAIRHRQIREGFSQGRISAILVRGKNHIMLGSDEGINELIDGKITALPLVGTMKSLLAKHDTIINASSVATASFWMGNANQVIDTFIWMRSTCVYERNYTYYIGTLNGLYTWNKTKKLAFLGDSNILLRTRIAAIAGQRDGTIWIATSGSGLVGYKDGKATENITSGKGLTSNICRNVLVSADSTIWVGTDKGLNKIIFSDTGTRIITYTSGDGLRSDIINAIEVDGNNVWAGTPEGLTYFDENEISKKSGCRLIITGITVSDNKWLPDTTRFALAHNDNNIQFDFVGISFKSGGDILYYYKLTGLDTSWKTTRETFLRYPSLPSGEYELQLFAVNKFGIKSNPVHIRFEVEKLLWQKTWFQALVILFAISLAWLIAYLRIRKLKKNAEQKMTLTKKVAELEQMALKSQMNPHFIFNSLNSIQQYVIDKDIVGANEFITQFSRLIRLTLDISSKLSISLEEELTYISTYLELEKKRFENKFVYNIAVSRNIDTENYFIPPMILQPYIENAVRHGMRYRSDNNGKILISIDRNEEYLVCIIEDNGIGRKQAMQLKSSTPIEYQSKGMTLTAKRIEVFNTMHSDSILVDINDLENDNREPVGTRITIFFPLLETLK